MPWLQEKTCHAKIQNGGSDQQVRIGQGENASPPWLQTSNAREIHGAMTVAPPRYGSGYLKPRSISSEEIQPDVNEYHHRPLL
nr:hypothetical protein Iba_chr13cCG18200 [Ipomoea batatas]GMD81488.1 hypothetical protein Iba_chr13eCG12080 [Ipomoea batatas]